jgi:hypothetical protein
MIAFLTRCLFERDRNRKATAQSLKQVFDAFPLGKVINYHGVQMYVSAHVPFVPAKSYNGYFSTPAQAPEIVAEYVDKNGVVRRHSFNPFTIEWVTHVTGQ